MHGVLLANVNWSAFLEGIYQPCDVTIKRMVPIVGWVGLGTGFPRNAYLKGTI